MDVPGSEISNQYKSLGVKMQSVTTYTKSPFSVIQLEIPENKKQRIATKAQSH